MAKIISGLDLVQWSDNSSKLASDFYDFIRLLLRNNTDNIGEIIAPEVDAFFLKHNICSVKSLKSARCHMERINWELVRKHWHAWKGYSSKEEINDMNNFHNGLIYMALGWIEENFALHAHGEMLLKKFWRKSED